jgi:hypothetical protein
MNKLDHKRQHVLLEIMNTNGAPIPQPDIDELLRPWQKLAAQLSALVGESGFCALFVRASRLSVARFDWILTPQSCRTVERALSVLGEALRSVDPLVARAGNTALLNTFTTLLADLIGQALTARLLDSVSGSGEEQKQEHK